MELMTLKWNWHFTQRYTVVPDVHHPMNLYYHDCNETLKLGLTWVTLVS